MAFKYQSDYDAMSDEELGANAGSSQAMIEKLTAEGGKEERIELLQEWLDELSAWEAAGRPR